MERNVDQANREVIVPGMPAGCELPSGLVTFVFTDIVGSTRLLRQLGPDYVELLHSHRRILRAAWARYGGHEVGVEGDSFLVAFADARAAVRACVESQAALDEHSWPEGVQLQVRMGVHTGWAVPVGEEYVSLIVHQAARVVDAAAGGQVLATADVVDAFMSNLRDAPPPLAAPLGPRTLRDFDGRVELYDMSVCLEIVAAVA